MNPRLEVLVLSGLITITVMSYLYPTLTLQLWLNVWFSIRQSFNWLRLRLRSITSRISTGR